MMQIKKITIAVAILAVIVCGAGIVKSQDIKSEEDNKVLPTNGATERVIKTIETEHKIGFDGAFGKTESANGQNGRSQLLDSIFNIKKITIAVAILAVIVCGAGIVKSQDIKSEEDNKVLPTNGATERVIKTIETEHKIGFDGAFGKTESANGQNGRSQLLDSIFNIPIATLKAVNDLVQNIAGNLQAAGSGTYFRKQSKVIVQPVTSKPVPIEEVSH